MWQAEKVLIAGICCSKLSTCLSSSKTVSQKQAIFEYKVMKGICCLGALPWQSSGCNSLHSCCRVPAS